MSIDDPKKPDDNIIRFQQAKGSYDNPQNLQTPVQFLTIQQLLNMPESTWLIENLIPDCACGQIFGQSQSYKSFISLHIALCICTGHDFFGHDTRQGQVLMMCGERIIDLPKRILGWQEHYEIDIENNHNILFTKGCFDICHTIKTKQFVSYLQWLKTHHQFNPDLIIIDTFSKAFGRNENSTEDMGTFLRNLDTIKNATSSAIMLVHHTGHTDQKRARGNSRLPDDLDFCILCERTEKFHANLTVTKQKDADCLENLPINLHPVHSDRGETLVATPFHNTFTPADILNDGHQHDLIDDPPDQPPDDKQQQALALLDDLLGEHQLGTIPLKDFRDACCEAGIYDRKNWSRTLKRLVAQDLVKIDGNCISRP